MHTYIHTHIHTHILVICAESETRREAVVEIEEESIELSWVLAVLMSCELDAEFPPSEYPMPCPNIVLTMVDAATVAVLNTIVGASTKLF